MITIDGSTEKKAKTKIILHYGTLFTIETENVIETLQLTLSPA